MESCRVAWAFCGLFDVVKDSRRKKDMNVISDLEYIDIDDDNMIQN